MNIIAEESFTSRNVVNESWKFRNLKQKLRDLNKKFRNMMMMMMIINYASEMLKFNSEMYGYLHELLPA